MSIKEQIDGLQILNVLDAEILKLRAAEKKFPEALAVFDDRLQSIKTKTDVIRLQVEELEGRSKSLEEAIAGERSQIKQWEGRLVEQSTTEGYTALAREIDIAKKTIATSEENLGAISSELTVARQKYAAAQEQMTRESEEIASQKAAKRKEIKKHEDLLAAKSAERAAARTKVDESLLARYEEACRHAGNGLAAVGKAGTCRGCNMRIRPQLLNILRASVIGECPSCHRLIYAEELLQPAAEAAAPAVHPAEDAPKAKAPSKSRKAKAAKKSDDHGDTQE